MPLWKIQISAVVRAATAEEAEHIYWEGGENYEDGTIQNEMKSVELYSELEE